MDHFIYIKVLFHAYFAIIFDEKFSKHFVLEIPTAAINIATVYFNKIFFITKPHSTNRLKRQPINNIKYCIDKQYNTMNSNGFISTIMLFHSCYNTLSSNYKPREPSPHK